MIKVSRQIISNKKRIKYYIYLPNSITDKIPVIVFLHGIGERGNNLRDIEKYALPKYMNKFDIPYIVIAPQCHEDNFWDYHLRDIEKILDIEYKALNFDKDNIFIAGSSMGAYGAWNFLLQRPYLFRGIISVAGGIMIPIKDVLLPIKDKAILIYHGDKDEIIDVSQSITAYNKLSDIGATNIELKIIKGDNHFLTSHAFKDDYMYEWLMKNTKGSK